MITEEETHSLLTYFQTVGMGARAGQIFGFIWADCILNYSTSQLTWFLSIVGKIELGCVVIWLEEKMLYRMTEQK